MKKIIFPQANNLDKVIGIFIYVANNSFTSKKIISEVFSFEERQVDYYLGACIYLGLLDSNNKITKVGIEAIESGKCKEYIISLILNDPIFCQAFSEYATGLNDDLKVIGYKLLKKYYPTYSESVLTRRASTINNWIIYIYDFIKNS